MKFGNLLTGFFIIFALVLSTGCREGDNSNAPIGKWELVKKQPSGETIRMEMDIKPGNKFSGVMFIDGVPAWTYGGRWSLVNNEFTYVYTESSKPLPENSDDTDIIISIDENKYTYKSKLTGEINTYHRMQ